MIRPEMIPDEVVKAALLTDERLGMKTVIAAALAAWPGARSDSLLNEYALTADPVVILPLPEAPQERGVSTENSDE